MRQMLWPYKNALNMYSWGLHEIIYLICADINDDRWTTIILKKKAYIGGQT